MRKRRSPVPVLFSISLAFCGVLLSPCVIFAQTASQKNPAQIERVEKTAHKVFHSDSPLRLISDRLELADGAAWDGAGRLFVPDVKGKRLVVFNVRDFKKKPNLRATGLAISGTCYQLGRLYISDNQGSRIAFFRDRGPAETLAEFESDDRPNDLTVDAYGNVYVTFTRKGLVRRIRPDGTVSVLCKDVVTPNGIALSPDGQSLYVSSAKTGRVVRVEIPAEEKTVSAQPFAQLPETPDGFRGDGMCVDRAGNVYVTGAEQVFVFAPSGTPMDSLKTPQRPINVVIGGNDGRQVFVSTFGGLYRTRINGYGVSPNPSMTADNKLKPVSTKIPKDIAAQLNVVFAEDHDRKLLMDVFSPQKNPEKKPALVVVHGGGWLNGDKTKFRALALRLAERGYVTASIEYRLGFEADFPAGIRDCNAATVFLRKHADEFGIDPDRIGVVGGSAGGHLAALMATGTQLDELKHSADHGADSHVSAAVVLAGPLQIASGSVAERAEKPDSKSNTIYWLGGSMQEKPRLYHLADAYEKISESTPPILFLCGSLDNPSRNEPARKKLNELGIPNELVVHPDAKHGHWNHPDWIIRVVDDIDAFLKKHL